MDVKSEVCSKVTHSGWVRSCIVDVARCDMAINNEAIHAVYCPMIEVEEAFGFAIPSHEA